MTGPAWMPACAGMTNYDTVSKGEGFGGGEKENLSGYKRPRSVVFVDDLPRNQLGKVLYKELRNRFEPE